MMASLNQSSSPSSFASVLNSGAMFTTRPSSREAAEDESGVLIRVGAQPDPAPVEGVALAGHQVFDGADAAACARGADLDVAEMEPKLPRRLRQCHRNRHGVVARNRFLDETDDLAVVDRGETQVAGLQQGGIALPHPVEAGDIVLDVSRLVPVAHLEFIFLGVEIFLFARDRLVLEELETVVDAIAARERRSEGHARL